MNVATRVWVAALCALCVWCVAESATQTSTPVPRSQRMPDLDWGPFYAKQLEKGNKSALGTKSTAVIVLGAAYCSACIESIEFYKSLMKLPDADGIKRTVIVVARDGVSPVATITDAHGFRPHLLTSGPYPRRPVYGVTQVPTVLVLDGSGNERGKWEGALSAQQRKAVIVAFTK